MFLDFLFVSLSPALSLEWILTSEDQIAACLVITEFIVVILDVRQRQAATRKIFRSITGIYSCCESDSTALETGKFTLHL